MSPPHGGNLSGGYSLSSIVSLLYCYWCPLGGNSLLIKLLCLVVCGWQQSLRFGSIFGSMSPGSSLRCFDVYELFEKTTFIEVFDVEDSCDDSQFMGKESERRV